MPIDRVSMVLGYLVNTIYNLLFIGMGLLIVLYGYLEYIGYGDGGKGPGDDLKVIVAGIIPIIFGMIGMYNTITGCKNRFTSILHIIFSFLISLLFMVVLSEMYINKLIGLYKVVFVCTVLLFMPISSFLFYKRGKKKNRELKKFRGHNTNKSSTDQSQ